MIEVLKEGYLRKVACNNCGALLRYNIKEDVKTDDKVIPEFAYNDGLGNPNYIICPCCKEKIIVKRPQLTIKL